ncbi:hypothetical protein CI109_102529 [Kwoniella shandongensis]|uniref:Uncharacterized protein n=1 Tax=Kwoniella shandongensis TaxID=1734106 RepID=A0A5M6BSP0_9TREE|nr:uncharacterized protein CI109_005856 [Kwoniella shandongensis]KAA5525833.1 hypothetical protein CI109_005856 [Kwoniella shandongensis]
MPDYHRIPDRPGPQHAPSSSGSGLGSSGSTSAPRLFSRRAWGLGRASATTKTSTGQEDYTPSSSTLSTPSAHQSLPPPQRQGSTDDVPSGSTTKPPTPIFHLEEAIHLMDPEGSTFASVSGPELVEHLKATAIYLDNLVNETEDVFSSPADGQPSEDKPDARSEVSPNDINTLYERAMAFVQPQSDLALRIAGLRLLNSLIKVAPPIRYTLEQTTVPLPDHITIRSLYALIARPTEAASGDLKTEFITMQAATLTSLSRGGTQVEGLVGLVGWLLRTLDEVRPDWVRWCESNGHQPADSIPKGQIRLKPFESIPSPTPLDAASSIISLIHSVVQNSLELFDPTTDIPRLLQPIFSFISQGIVASSPHLPDLAGLNISQGRRDSSPIVSLNSLLPNASGSGPILESNLRRAVSSSRPRKDTVTSTFSTPSSSRIVRHSTFTSPQSSASVVQSPSPQYATLPVPRWLYLLPSACAFLEIFIHNTVLPQDLFIDVMRFACICVVCDDEAQTDTGQIPVHRLLATMFRSNNGRRGEYALRVIMEQQATKAFRKTYDGLADADCKVVQGAVYIARSLLLHLDDPSPVPSSLPSTDLSSLTPSLIAALSTARFADPEKRVERARWQPVDYAVLTLLQDHLHRMELSGAHDAVKGDIWNEGQSACEILKALLPVALPSLTAGYALHIAEEQSTFSAVFDAVVHQLPTAIEQLHPTATSASPFYHPKYIDLLFLFGEHLSEDDAAVILEYYQREGLCLPMTAGWIENIWKLIDLLFLSNLTLPIARENFAATLFGDIYTTTEEVSESRTWVVSQVIVPFLEKTLLKQSEDWFRRGALAVMIRAAVSETMERDEERRSARAMKNDYEVEEEDASALPSQEVKDAAAGGSFHAIRNLLISLASTAWCKDDDVPRPDVKRPSHPIAKDSTASNSSAIKGLMNALSPPSRTKELPAVAPPVASPEESSPKPVQSQQPNHSACHSLDAVSALITIFNRLCFSPPHSFSSTAKAARTPASSRCITIYRDLLGLLYPFAEHSGTDTPTSRVAAIPARCPRARVTILQWLLRLRADPRHRIYLRTNIDVAIKPYAETLFRTKEAVETQRTRIAAETDEARARAKLRQIAASPRETMRERGSTSTRSRSRSRPPPESGSDTFNPLWSVPESLTFSMPADSLPSEGLLTYDPNHPSLRVKDAPPVEGVWLPVSEYVRVLNGILRHEQNWELVSYVLCFLPLQLSNKLFFRGGRATKEVKALLRVLIDTLPQDDRIERRCKSHLYIKRPNVNAAVYQSLSILISYRDVLDRDECDNLITAFEMCLESSTVVAKPCIQALTLSIFELESHVGKRLLSIIDKLRGITFTSGIAVHLLEFLLALGQNKNLFRNFTDAHYKDVFTLVVDYIAEHNARSDESPDLKAAAARENYTLSQHVIGLAYHSIYVWFMALKLTVRPDLVKHIIIKLLQSRSKRVTVDEMAEVCFDWLARYTYGNADPRPSTSFLADVVMQDPREDDPPKSQSWVLGGAILTIRSHSRSGWATITSTRPTGTTEIIAKLENVPLLGLGEANADLSSLPAVLMANRNTIMSGDSSEIQDLVKQKSTVPPQEEFDQSSQHGYIWSGATPSQRRKDVAIDPAYLAVELLSSYPNASLEVPRGRLIPKEERYLRALRNIEMTPVIDTSKLGVLYVGPGQTTETEILGNIDGSSLYLDFLAGLGRLIRLKGQVDVFVGGLNREDDSDGEYAYAWWDDLDQTIFHTATMMPNHATDPTFSKKKRLIGNDYVKIVYNDSGKDFTFDTIKTAFNFINVVISPHTTPDTHGPAPVTTIAGTGGPSIAGADTWAVWGRDDYFKVIVQRAPGIPDFSPVGEHKIVSRETLPVFIRHVAHLANDMAARYTHIRDAREPSEAEYITSWRSRLRAMTRLRATLPPIEKVDPNDEGKKEELLRDFTRVFSYRPPTESSQ